VQVAAPAADGGSDAIAEASLAVTYNKDVAPIIQARCQTCHTEGGIAPFTLSTYAHARNMAGAIVEETGAKRMPPWGARETAECTPPLPWRDDERLSDAQIATIKAWVDGGMVEGNPADLPPPKVPTKIELATPSVELVPTSSYTPIGTKDQFRCFVLDPKITERQFLNGSYFVPGNPKIVHHALLFTDPKRESLKKAKVGESYDCFGGPGINTNALLGAWAPGARPQEFPSNAGTPIEANTLFVMQVHYHPHEGVMAPDTTRVQLRYLTGGLPTYFGYAFLQGNFQKEVTTGSGLMSGPDDPATGVAFEIPAGATKHTETMVFTVPEQLGGVTMPTLHLATVGAHMHYVGVDEKIWIERKDGTSQCLLQEPAWNFNWQRGYTYDGDIDKLPTLNAGDKIKLRCTYDNSLANPFVADALKQQGLTAPQTVKLGETTLDEMCLGAFQVLFKLF
jgi:hypothetical protein